MGEKKYFTPREIDTLIPQLELIFGHIETCKTRAGKLAAQTLARVESSVPADVARRQLLRSQVEFLMEAIHEDIRQIQRIGGITKDLEIGLVDFLGDVEGEDVWLCWKKGEPRVRFWHSLDSGYSQRRLITQPQPNTHH